MSIDEITSLFEENGINMSESEVADMFANAQRMHLSQRNRQYIQSCKSSPIPKYMLDAKPTEYNLKMEMTPEQFRVVS